MVSKTAPKRSGDDYDPLPRRIDSYSWSAQASEGQTTKESGMRNIKRHEEDEYQNYMDSLATAHIAAQNALDALYRPYGPKRSFMRRWALGRAQSTLISLYVKEQQEADRRKLDGK